jgi:hypothetical protein
MRAIRPSLTPELKAHCRTRPVWRAEPFKVSNFRSLVEHAARLAYANADELLFFRGQGQDFQSKAGGTTLYPSIYRGDALAIRELRHRFELLDQAARTLADRFRLKKIEGHRELRRKKYIQWSILQHYEVAATPLLDITHSLRVACSFAHLGARSAACYVYVLGLPYITNRISINSEHDIVNVRLLSICPPAALRPYFQEGYVAGTADVTTEFDSKTELDFRNRLIAKFEIPRAQSFWGAGFDQILDLCLELKAELRDELKPGDLGEFIREWATVEDYLLKNARLITNRDISTREAIKVLAQQELLRPGLAESLDAIRSFRNSVVHRPESIQATDLGIWLDRVRDVIKFLPKKSPARSYRGGHPEELL